MTSTKDNDIRYSFKINCASNSNFQFTVSYIYCILHYLIFKINNASFLKNTKHAMLSFDI